jgi:hypothetical protein
MQVEEISLFYIIIHASIHVLMATPKIILPINAGALLTITIKLMLPCCVSLAQYNVFSALAHRIYNAHTAK